MVLTDNEKRELALEILRILKEQSLGINELPKAETMDGIDALPAYQTKDGVESAVVVPISLLGKPAIDAAGVAQEVIELARKTITDTETAIDAANEAAASIEQSKEAAAAATVVALEAAGSVDAAKLAATDAAKGALKATESAYRASDDADSISSAVSEEWSELKNKIAQSTTSAEEAVQNVNDFIAENGGKLITPEEREKLLNTYTKSETYCKQEVDGKNQETLESAREYVTAKIAEMIGGAPEALDTLFEISAALGNDPAFATSIMALINGKADSVHTHTKEQIADFPASLPASDVYPWAKQSEKPSYSAMEVGAAAAGHKHAATEIETDEQHRFISDQELKKLSTLSNSIKNGDKASFDEYTEPGKYYVYDVSNGPISITGATGYFVLLEVEVLPSGVIYQTVRNAMTGGSGRLEIYMRCFCSDSLRGVNAWSRWYAIFSETERITTAPITTPAPGTGGTTPAPETGGTTPAPSSGNTNQTPESADITTPTPPTTPPITTPAPESDDANQREEEFEVIITPMPPDLLSLAD